MKVLHIIGGGDSGGAKTHVLSLVKQLGNHIHVKLISLRSGPFSDDARDMGIDVEVVRSGNILKDIRTITNIVFTGEYNIIHTHGAKANMIGVFVKKRTGIPVVTTIHSDYRLDYLHSVLKMYTFGLINTIALRLVDYYISVSQIFKDMLIKRGFPADRIQPVYNGIPFDDSINLMPRDEFCRKYGLDLQPGDVSVGILARLHPVKGHTVFLDAAAKVLQEFPNTKFLIAGGGDDLLPSLEKRAEHLGIRKNVFFLGMVEEPFTFLNIIDINVLASYSESFPYAILEGARMKKATVSSRVGGLEDLFVQGENGYLFTPGDSDALAAHLITLLKDPAHRKEIGSKLFETARDHFSLKSMTETQLNIYRTILSKEAQYLKDGKTHDIVILGYYGYRNSGDDAILKSFIDHLQANHKGLSTVVMSNDPSETRSLYRVQSIHRFNIFQIPALLAGTRVFIAGGGTLIQDDTSSRSLWYYLYMLHLAVKKGAHVVLLANGLGPLTKKKNRKAASKILNRLDAITLRDPNAFEELKSLGVTKPITRVTADPALALKPCSPQAGAEILKKAGVPVGEKLFALCLRRWKKVKQSEKILAAYADKIVSDFHAVPVFIAMQHPEDVRYARKILKHMKHKGYVLTNRYTVDETLSILGNVSMVIGMRLHSLIYALNLGIPMVGLAYQPKIDYFMESIQQPFVPWNEKFSMEDLMHKTHEVWQNADEINRDLVSRKPILEEKVREAMDLTLSFLK